MAGDKIGHIHPQARRRVKSWSILGWEAAIWAPLADDSLNAIGTGQIKTVGLFGKYW